MSEIPRVSVVIPAYNAQATLADCLRAVAAQSLPRAQYEIIVVDDGSTDATVAVASRFNARVVRQANSGAASARNIGWRAARGRWTAFTDADCIPSRGWLKMLLQAVESGADDTLALGAAGKTMGFESNTPAARFVDLTGGFDAGRHLAHPRFPFAPSGNVLYRREALEAVGGFDERYRSYEACDLHGRLIRADAGRFTFAPAAIVFHRHRASWKQYWRQQVSYGFGYAQFARARFDEIRWSPWDEFNAWMGTAALGVRALAPGEANETLVRRGNFVKQLAHRVGFCSSYWNAAERAQW